MPDSAGTQGANQLSVASVTASAKFRGTVSVIITTKPEITSAWVDGPLRLELRPGVVTDAQTRRTYYEHGAASSLYGPETGGVRWHQLGSPSGENGRIIGVEYLTTDSTSGVAGILIVHLERDDLPLEKMLEWWSGLVRWKGKEGASGPLSKMLVESMGTALLADEWGSIAYHMALWTGPLSSDLYADSQQPLTSQAAFSLASATTEDQFPPANFQWPELLKNLIPLSNDWSCLVLRDGASFVGSGSGDSEFLERDGWKYFHSIYTDSFLLGTLQLLSIRSLADELATIRDPYRSRRTVNNLDQRLSRFRNEYWWQHLTKHGHATEMLIAHQEQNRTREILDQTQGELQDYSRQGEAASGRSLNVLLAVLAVIAAASALLDVFRFAVAPDNISLLQLSVFMVVSVISCVTIALFVGGRFERKG